MTNFVLVNRPSAPERKSRQGDYILLDRSGSMTARWEQAVTAVNAYIGKLKNKAVNANIKVAVFNNHYQVIRDAPAMSCAPINNADVVPEGGTALNDSIGRLVAQAKADNPQIATIS